MQQDIYYVQDLDSARIYLDQAKGKVILTNKEGSTRYYGMRVLDYIFKTLQKEYPSKISQIIINTDTDYSGFVTAKQCGYNTDLLLPS